MEEISEDYLLVIGSLNSQEQRSSQALLSNYLTPREREREREEYMVTDSVQKPSGFFRLSILPIDKTVPPPSITFTFLGGIV